MALLANPTVRVVVQVVLAIVILVLSYVLYETIRGPQRVFLQEQALTQESRDRMLTLRTALTTYTRTRPGYPSTLDSLELVIRQDSFFVARRDSIFAAEAQQRRVQSDSLTYSSRGPRFEYQVVRDDSLNIWTYVLRDPATGDSIGTASIDRASALRNVASWE